MQSLKPEYVLNRRKGENVASKSSEKQDKRLFWLFAALDLLWIAFIISRSLKTADLSLKESGRILALVKKILPFMTEFLIRKLGHFTEFFILGILLFLTGRQFMQLKNRMAAADAGTAPRTENSGKTRQAENAAGFCLMFFFPAAAGLAVAVCDECIQLGVEGRSGEVRDVLIDLSGVLLALLLSALIRKLRISRKTVITNHTEGEIT